jgi:glycine/D-amino acid oxidase-like deaminating enzyme
MLDYIIIGAGLSGIAVTEELLSLGKKIRVFENGSQASSTVAGGIFNPVILKRFTLAWEADRQLKTAIPFYRTLEQKLDISIVKEMPIYRKFHSVEEQNDWFAAIDKPSLSQFLSPHLIKDLNPCIPAEFSFGKVAHTGIIQTEVLLSSYREYLLSRGSLISEGFDYDQLQLRNNKFHYKGFQAERIIFCEGFGMIKNPFFSNLPLTGNKGEYIIIESSELQLEVAVKSSVFILPLGKDLYKVGATYNNYDKSTDITKEAREYLLKKLKATINCDFKIVGHIAGVRPATKDRKPLVGEHPEYKNLFVCNGFGSRGVLIAPTMAKELVAHLETGQPIDPEVDIRRFRKS